MESLAESYYCFIDFVFLIGSMDMCYNLLTFHLLILTIFLVVGSKGSRITGSGLATNGTTELIRLAKFYSIEKSTLFAVSLVLKIVVTITY